MKHSTAAWRLARKASLGVTGVAAAALVLAASAGAAIIPVAPDNANGTDNLNAAIAAANTNGDTSNTIVLSTPGTWAPLAPLPAITKNLRITADHTVQASGAASFDVDGGQVVPLTSNLFTVNAGITLELDGFAITGASAAPNTAIQNNGTVNLNNMAMEAEGATSLNMGGGTFATLNDTLIDGNPVSAGISDAGGTLTLNNSTVSDQCRGGILNSGGTLTLNNSLIANNNVCSLKPAAKNCQSLAQAHDSSLDNDGTCGVTTNTTYWNTTTNPFPGPNTNGGPTGSVQLDPAAPTVGKGDPAKCLPSDQRFFVIPTGSPCDIGAVTNSATQETTPPKCVVSALIAGPPKQQQVTVSDPSGIGPEQGALTDPNTDAQADSVTNLFISNGTVAAPTTGPGAFPAITLPSGPTTSGVVLTATKTDQTMLTKWNFTATNWAGVSGFCN